MVNIFNISIILAGIFVRNTLVTYDRGNDRIGFWKTNCSELWDRLHVNTISSQSPLSPFIAPSDGPSSSEQDDMISPGWYFDSFPMTAGI